MLGVGQIARTEEERDELYDHGLRVCSVCNTVMDAGYYVEGPEYFCSDACLHTRYTDEEYQQMYEDDVAYYTEWE